MSCAWHDRGSAELFFYGELDAAERQRFAAHLESCTVCRAALADLEIIRRALDARRAAAAPPAESWEPFMQRLDAQLERAAARQSRRWPAGSALRIAATVAIAAGGLWAGFVWQRARSERAVPLVTQVSSAREKAASAVPTLVSATDEHLERSKLVLLGLAAKDARRASPSDWQYERRLASTLLADTTQYRLAAAEHGRADLAGVLGDLETVLLEASLGDESDPRALGRLQRLIDKRDLLTKIQVVTTREAAPASR